MYPDPNIQGHTMAKSHDLAADHAASRGKSTLIPLIASHRHRCCVDKVRGMQAKDLRGERYGLDRAVGCKGSQVIWRGLMQRDSVLCDAGRWKSWEKGRAIGTLFPWGINSCVT